MMQEWPWSSWVATKTTTEVSPQVALPSMDLYRLEDCPFLVHLLLFQLQAAAARTLPVAPLPVSNFRPHPRQLTLMVTLLRVPLPCPLAQ